VRTANSRYIVNHLCKQMKASVVHQAATRLDSRPHQCLPLTYLNKELLSLIVSTEKSWV
jgi:hypothetical protein